jgi:hypothetical protein
LSLACSATKQPDAAEQLLMSQSSFVVCRTAVLQYM